jgi:kynurenine formamidase
VVSLNLGLTEIDPPLFGRTALARELRPLAGGTAFDETLTWNVQTTSQWDGFGHVVEPSVGSYNGLDRDQHGVGLWLERGIVGRGILADVARRRARLGSQQNPLRRGEIAFSEVLAALDDEGLATRAGDILLVRTGWLAAYRSLTPAARSDLAAGGGESLGFANSIDTVRGLWTAKVAAVAADNPSLEAWPPTAPRDEGESSAADWEPAASLHRSLLVRLGMPIGELWDLDRLADVCAEEKRYEFLLVSVPIALMDGIASPANAVAML